jgi:hypothetical protein
VSIVEDLLHASELDRHDGHPEMDPFTEADALQETQVLDLRFDALRSSIGCIFELRSALQLRAANTGVLVAQKVHTFAWTSDSRSTDATAWTVITSTPRLENRLVQLDLEIIPEASLRIVAEVMAFYVVEVPNLDDAPPDYGVGGARARTDLAGWRSTFLPVHSAFLSGSASDH